MAVWSKTYKVVKQKELGYAYPFGSSGESYDGIDRLFHANWPGWKIIDAIKAKRKIGQGEIINNPQLEQLVSNFYYQFIMGLFPDYNLVNNQTVADFVCDFLFHKQYDAVKVINTVAARFMPISASSTKVAPGAVAIMNAKPNDYYRLLKASRTTYYNDPSFFGSKVKFSPKLAKALINRVNSFPQNA